MENPEENIRFGKPTTILLHAKTAIEHKPDIACAVQSPSMHLEKNIQIIDYPQKPVSFLLNQFQTISYHIFMTYSFKKEVNNNYDDNNNIISLVLIKERKEVEFSVTAKFRCKSKFSLTMDSHYAVLMIN